MSKVNRSVVRNKAYPRNNFSIRERHNERKNSIYSNPDIVKERSDLNIHFKRCDGTYAQKFDQLLAEKTISTRGLKQDADVFAEMVFDVNTAYFEEHGGYEYAKGFFAEAYKMAAQEAGGEQYVLSAVMHADERNKSLSEKLGQDVYHYHLHVVYIPVVEKEIKWTKRCKNKELVGTFKEVIQQVSHSKKWASVKAVDNDGKELRDEKGKAVLIQSYSLLQDRFFEHMKNAGFKNFERGERGSNAKHLSVLEYKLKQDQQRLAHIEKSVAEQTKELANISESLEVKQKVRKTYTELDGMGKKKLFGKVELSEQDYRDVMMLAKEALTLRSKIETLKRQWRDLSDSFWALDDKFTKLFMSTKDYIDAMRIAPERVKEVIAEVFQKAREEHQRRKLERKHTRGRSR